MDKVTRRSFVTTVGAATVVPAAALMSPTAHAAATAKTPADAARMHALADILKQPSA